VHWYGMNGSVTMYLGDGGGSSCSGSWLMTGGGLGLDMSLSCSSCAGSSSGVGTCWSHGMGSIGILGMGGTEGGSLMMMVGGRIGDGGNVKKGSENWGGL